MNPDTLRHFLTLSRTLHFGRASRACHLSPSALSRSIQRLEEEVGARLLERDNRSVSLTAAGQSFQRYATEVLDRYALLQSELEQDAEQLTGSLSIFATVTACYSFLPDALADFRAAHAGVTLRLQTGNAEEALAELERDAVEISVAALPERLSAHLEASPILQTPLIFIAPRVRCGVSELVECRPVPWREVPLIAPRFGLTRRHLDRWLRARRIKPRIENEVAGNEAILSLVALGCGIGVVPRLVLEKSPLRRDVRVLVVRPALPSFRVGFLTKKKKLESPLIGAFWDSVTRTQSERA